MNLSDVPPLAWIVPACLFALAIGFAARSWWTRPIVTELRAIRRALERGPRP